MPGVDTLRREPTFVGYEANLNPSKEVVVTVAREPTKPLRDGWRWASLTWLWSISYSEKSVNIRNRKDGKVVT